MRRLSENESASGQGDTRNGIRARNGDGELSCEDVVPSRAMFIQILHCSIYDHGLGTGDGDMGEPGWEGVRWSRRNIASQHIPSLALHVLVRNDESTVTFVGT